MFRKAATAVILLCVSTSSSVFALGLGDIEIQSALNQPFRAVVELTSASDADLQQLQVGLAPREAYERAGIPRAGILSEFSFSVDRTSAGEAVVRITSTVPVQEPFLDFLLEAVWSRGRLVRQYTVLVDPPVTMPATPVAPAAPVSRAPRPVPVTPAPRESQPQPPRPPVTPTRAAPPPPPPTASADEYGPVRRSETLWQIAREVRPGSDISMQQMMISLQRANPSAFINKNINNLKAGATLQIPQRDEILSLSRAEARSEVSRQHTEWKTGRTAPAPAPVAEAPAPESAEAETAAGTEEPDAEAEPEAAAPVAEEAAPEVLTESRLQLVAPEEEAIAGEVSPGETRPGVGQDAAPGALAEQLAVATEEAEASRAQSEELQSRVSTLEEQVAQLQRLLELKDQELASIQDRVAADDLPIEAGEAAPETPVAEGELEPESATMAEEAAPAAAMEAEDTAAADDTHAADRDAQHEPRRLVDRLLDNPVLTGLGVLVAMVLGGFLWASTRQRKSADMFEDEPTLASRLAESREESPPPTPIISVREEGVSEQGMFGDAAASDVSPLHGEGDGDPLTEADVFIAYGRVQQAEEVIQTALKKNPTDNELKVKLMEVYYAAANIGAFDSHADSFRRMVDEADPLWQKVANMGHELSPTNPLYKSVEQVQASETGMEDAELSAAEADLAEIVEIEEIQETMAGQTEAAVEGAEVSEDKEFSLEGHSDQAAGEAQAHDEAEGLLESNDEVATKLDLARAYMDMGDPDGARSILQEVLAEGNEHQVGEAEELLSQLT